MVVSLIYLAFMLCSFVTFSAHFYILNVQKSIKILGFISNAIFDILPTNSIKLEILKIILSQFQKAIRLKTYTVIRNIMVLYYLILAILVSFWGRDSKCLWV